MGALYFPISGHYISKFHPSPLSSLLLNLCLPLPLISPQAHNVYQIHHSLLHYLAEAMKACSDSMATSRNYVCTGDSRWASLVLNRVRYGHVWSCNAVTSSRVLTAVESPWGRPASVVPLHQGRVVILGVWRLTGGRAGVPAHNARRKSAVLYIFFEYSLKIPKIYSNILKYAWTYSIFPCRVGTEVYRTRQVGRRSGWAGGRTDNPASWDQDNAVERIDVSKTTQMSLCR
jgi:hypothetical protein